MNELQYHKEEVLKQQRTQRVASALKVLTAVLVAGLFGITYLYVSKPQTKIVPQTQHPTPIQAPVFIADGGGQAKTSPNTSTTPSACTPSQLNLLFGSELVDGQTTQLQIVLTDTSPSPCNVMGHPGLQLVGMTDGGELSFDPQWTDTKPQIVSLSTGTSAHAWLTFPSSATGCPSNSLAFTPKIINLIPPNESSQMSIHWIGQPLYLCTGPGSQPTISIFLPGSSGSYPN